MSLDRPSLIALLEREGIPHKTTDHPPLFTVEQSKALRGTLGGGHTKNLFLKDKKGQHFLVTMEEDTEVDLKTLHTRIGGSGRVSFGKPEEMLAFLGVTPGAVTLFGALNDTGNTVRVVIDEGLLAHDEINCHPLTNTATTTISTRDLVALLTRHGHEPTVLPRV